MNPLQQYIDDLEFPDASTREAAAHAIHDLGDAARDAAPALFAAILRETDACPWVGTALTRIGPLAADLDALESALRSDNSHVRFWAARTIVKLGPDAEPLIPILISLLCDSHHPVTDSVVWALGTIGIPAISPLVDATHDDDAELRGRAVLALGRYPQDAAIKLPAIVKSLDDPDPNVRRQAAHAICSLGQDAHPDRDGYDAGTFSTLVAAIDRIADGDSIDVDAEWFGRVHGWLRPSA
ncbi:HEAT repeat domain-containing protein [Rhodopirellula bahusiensis]|uniref:HEAT repeat domain-containing protein n=1 Tax=Rhodopirellula bahusiensis TaxID=2014065 RepID=UPI0013047252|nr:HEAT repeat domain-containing protein [Rhodopirellula bahusiensis]